MVASGLRWLLSAAASLLVLLCLVRSTEAHALVGARKYQLLADLGLSADDLSSSRGLKDVHTLIANLGADTGGEAIHEEFVQLKLDHFGASGNKTFPNRFWVSESGYQKGGPVFIFDGGEGNAEPGALRRLSKDYFFKQMVDQFHGIGIVWEHRFYGKSSPVNITLDTSAEEFRHLTAQQALADVVEFAGQFSRDSLPGVDLTPKSTPWVFVGGSYPGMRAAFVRNVYPDTIYASYASSAPVQASIDMSFYFEPAVRGLVANGWANCTRDIGAAVTHMDKLMSDPIASGALKRLFLGRDADKSSNAGFADALATNFAFWQSFGVEGGDVGLRSFCDWISTDPDSQQTAPAEGWAPTKGAEFTTRRWATWPGFVKAANSLMFTNCEGSTASLNQRQSSNSTVIANVSCDLDLRFPDPDAISWTWQYCTQWGYFQSANLGPNQVVSKWNSLQHQREVCHRQFPDGSSSGLLPDWPAAAETNADLGGWAIRPSNVYWSGGEFDPWRTLSPLSTEPFAPDYTATQQVPACGVKTSASTLFGYTLPNSEHCFDFRNAAHSADSRKNFTNALAEWLRCFPGRV